MEDFSKYKKLNPLEIRGQLKDRKGWDVIEGRLNKEFRFPSFARAMIFVNKIINPIEENQNYPKITITYDRVAVSLFTHAASAITQMDVDIAIEMSEIYGPDDYHPEAGMLEV